MKRILTYIFGLIIMAAPFAPSTADEVIVGTPPTVTVTGTVLDENSKPLIGATVVVVGTYNGAATNLEGIFKIDKAPSNATLSISYIGYTTQTINLSDYTAQNDRINISAPIKLAVGTEISEEAIIDAEGNGYTICRATDTILIGTYNEKKCAPCACKPGYLLTDRHMAPASYTIKYTDQAAETTLKATADTNNICPNTATYGCTDTDIGPQCVNGGLSEIFKKTKDFQCIKQTGCHDSSREVGVEKSKYVLTNNKYTCQKTCFTKNGYILNERNNTCEPENKCDPDDSTHPQAATAKYVGEGNNRKCVPSSCNCGYNLTNPDTENANCTEWTNDDKQNKCEIRGATKTYRYCLNNREYCHAVECNEESYEHKSNTELSNHTLPAGDSELTGGLTKPYTCIAHERRRCNEEQRTANATNLEHSTKSSPMVPDDGTPGVQVCLPTECECGYDLKDTGKKNAKCESWSTLHGTDKPKCSEPPEHATEYYRDCKKGTEYCHITACEGDYEPNNSNDACVGKRGECEPVGATHPDKIWDSKYKTVKGVRKCVITKCATGYEPNEDGSDCTPLMVLPEKESQDRIDELRTVYDAAHKNETSIANKTLGAASMAATGAGGMMLASGLSEQKADKEAEEKMRGYVATFKCNYGNTNVEYGTQPTELPMSTELYNLYAEYVTLANDLKLRKEMLGLRAGIESEKILDSATTGLYDDVSSGRSAGMYTSLARAILDPNGADAAAWAEQTKRSKNLIIAGATTAGVGVVGSIVGNQLINKDAPTLASVRQEIANINSKYLKLKQSWDALQKKIDDQPTTKTCTGIEGVSGGTYPDCECTNKNYIFSPDTLCSTCGLTGYTAKEECECVENAEPKDLNCTCKDNYTYNKGTHTCLLKSEDNTKPEPEPECLLTGLVDTDRCECIEHATAIDKDCQCTDHYHEEKGACIENEQIATDNFTPKLDLSTDNLFDSGDSIIQDNDNIINAAAEFSANYDTIAQNYCVQITGHTDRIKFKSSKMNNQILSEKRAKAVADEFKKALSNEALSNPDRKYNICYQGKAEAECTKDTYEKDNDKRCRKVTLQYLDSACPDDCQLI